MSPSDVDQGAGQTPLALQSPAPAISAARPAAKKVYDLLEIRLQIYRLLSRPEQTILLRVEKKGMGLVVGEMYREMGNNTAHQVSSADKSRLQLYRNAIKVINAHTERLDLPPQFRQAFGFEEADPDQPEDEADEDEREARNHSLLG